MPSASGLGTGRCLVDLDLQQIKIVLHSKSFADVWVAHPEAEEMRCGISFSDEGGGGRGEPGCRRHSPLQDGSVSPEAHGVQNRSALRGYLREWLLEPSSVAETLR